MKAPRIFFLLALMASFLSLQGMSFVPESNDKPIKAVLEFYPNYAGHLLGVAQIGYQSSYAETYKESIYPKDLEYLRENADLIRWSEGDEGILSYFFLTFPGYVNPESKSELGSYLTDLNSAVAQQSFDEFKEKYQPYIENLELWSGFNENPLIFNYSEEIQSISKILMNNYDSFKTKVWPEYSAYMEGLANAMNEKFLEWNLIEKWETLTGMDFKAESYKVVLSTGMENGPTGKALGYEKEWYYYGDDPAEMIHSICQEAGLRILSGLCSEKYKKNNPLICFEVYKSLSHYLTDQIMADLGIDELNCRPGLVSSEIYSIFDLLWTVNPDMKVRELYNVAVDTYTRTKYAVNVK